MTRGVRYNIFVPKITPLSKTGEEVILGSLLGDGSIAINPNYKNARLSFRHSVLQKEYFWWKVSLLKEISGPSCTWEQPADGYSQSPKLRYQSLALPVLTDIYQLVTKDKKKVVSRKWLNKLTPLGLAAWWLDDGSIIGVRKGVFCTDGYSRKEAEIIKQYFKIVWGLNTTVGEIHRPGGKTFTRVYLRSTEELRRFLLIILPQVKVPQMLPKVLLLYKDPILQQRWVSEVIRLTGFSEETVNFWLKVRKSKSKKFRE